METLKFPRPPLHAGCIERENIDLSTESKQTRANRQSDAAGWWWKMEWNQILAATSEQLGPVEDRGVKSSVRSRTIFSSLVNLLLKSCKMYLFRSKRGKCDGFTFTLALCSGPGRKINNLD